MKKFIAFLCAASLLLLSACTVENDVEETTLPQPVPVSREEKLRGVWLSCYELAPMFSSGTRDGFEKAAAEVIANCKENEINALFVQVRPFCDAIYPSEIFGWSRFAISSQGEPPAYDALQILTALCHSSGIKIHAWINPYRVSYSPDYSELDSECPALAEGYRSSVVSIDSGIYFNPASLEAQSLVLAGVREILKNYEVDGIHIDDYFYPTSDESFDAAEYKNYCDLGGMLSLGDWRRENVNALVAAMYALVKTAGSGKIFSVSPAADIEKNYSEQYADVALWFSSSGFADLIIPQIYFGFEHETMAFENVFSQWKALTIGSRVRFACGLAAYKAGREDKFAGSGVDEWVNFSDIISRQTEFLLEDEACLGYVLFSYNHAF